MPKRKTPGTVVDLLWDNVGLYNIEEVKVWREYDSDRRQFIIRVLIVTEWSDADCAAFFELLLGGIVGPIELVKFTQSVPLGWSAVWLTCEITNDKWLPISIEE